MENTRESERVEAKDRPPASQIGFSVRASLIRSRDPEIEV